MKSHTHHNCTCHFVPDIVLKQLGIKKNGPTDKAFRLKRSNMATMMPKLTITGAADRIIYDCQNKDKSNKVLVFKEEDTVSKDADVLAVYENAEIIRDYFRTQLNWLSIDGNGMDMIFNIHYRRKYSNAFWDGEEMTFGDGDGINFTAFSKSLDVTAHELTHGVIQYVSGLNYKGQSGALNEHFADVFGMAIKQWHKQETPQTSDWLLGADCLLGIFKGKGVRSMKDPGNMSVAISGQPDHMSKFFKGASDNGGVHVNSGIPNKAFYLVSMEIGTQQAALLWFEALKLLKPDAKFKALYTALLKASKKLVKDKSIPVVVKDVLDKAFREVGIIK